MKKAFLFVAVALAASLGFTACDDDDNGGTSDKFSGRLTIVEEEYDDETGDYIYKSGGSVTNQVDEIEIYAYPVDDSDYNSEVLGTFAVSNGKFSITLPTPLPSKFLENIAEDMPEEISVSDKTAKIGGINFRPLKDGSRVGYMYRGTLAEDVYVEYLYADKDVKITGEAKEEYYDETEIVKYNITFRKGWNTLVGKETVSGNTYTYTLTANNEPSNVIWAIELDSYYYDYNASSLKSTKAFSERNNRLPKFLFKNK